MNYGVWEEAHLFKLLKLLVEHKWKEGLVKALLSFTTQQLIASQNCQH